MPTDDFPLLRCDVPRLVLDTNVVLDWLLFRNPGCEPLAEALTSGRALWVATAAMHDELRTCLHAACCKCGDPTCRRSPRRATAGHTRSLPSLGHCSRACAAPIRTIRSSSTSRCSSAAPSLLSRDRAVLKLARRARDAGIAILTPEAWAMSIGA